MANFCTKLKLTHFFLLLLFLPFLSYTQNTVLEPAKTSAAKTDTAFLLLIPYNPMYYLSDSDRQIAEASNKSVSTIRDNFRFALDQALKKQFSEKYRIHSILIDTTEQAGHDLGRIYFEQVLKYEESPAFQKENQNLKKRKKSSGEKGFEIETSTMTAENALFDDKYMNVSFKNPDILPELAARYENDYFLFLNQFEIRIDYNDCLDFSKRIYNRQMKVHYSIYDKNGKFFSGDYVKVLFPSNTNHVNEIISRNFPDLARQLAEGF